MLKPQQANRIIHHNLNNKMKNKFFPIVLILMLTASLAIAQMPAAKGPHSVYLEV
jgi:hypothetical protein